MLLHISSFWSNLERNSPNTCQIITALITVEMEIFYKRNSLIKFSTVGCFKVITVLYCTAEEAESYSVRLPTERTKAQEQRKTLTINSLRSAWFQGCFHPIVSLYFPGQ